MSPLPAQTRAETTTARRTSSPRSLVPQHPGSSPNTMTIEQLAAVSQMSVRNIRSHQARGLVSPPEVRVRVGYYGAEHREQLRVIRDLQSDGFNLRGIMRLFSIAAELAGRGVPLTVILDALDATRDA